MKINGFEELSTDEAMFVNGGGTVQWNWSQFGAVVAGFVQEVSNLVQSYFPDRSGYVDKTLLAITDFFATLPDVNVTLTYA
ncbi:MAG: hypothetical protein LBT44_01390 [Clostridiales bacterium]|jgi:hypothetical protein|nr:hypothetical protein [Clostridiales bacterium]